MLMIAIGGLVGAGLAAYLAQFRFSRQISLITQSHADAVHTLRLANDERLGKERQSFLDQLEKVRITERASFQETSEQVKADHNNQLKETVDRYESKLKEQVESDLSV